MSVEKIKINKKNKLVIKQKLMMSKKKKILYVSEDIHNAIKEVAEETGNTINDVVTQLILYGLENIEK